MKLSRILLSTVAIATVAACGNLSKVTDAGTPEYKRCKWSTSTSISMA